ncbi:MAG: hypothetical protein KKC03_09230 [Bacteroidetes bacterium]|nr:hypothetical protein [Bacteroidota bacterium]
MKTSIIAVCFLTFVVGFAQTQIPDAATQIKIALQAAPEDKRDAATVLGFEESGAVVTLKAGTNEFICLTDDPFNEGFNAACYHKSLSDFMARGRELKTAGKTSNEIFEIRENEAKSGTLKMPEQPATLYVLYGRDARFDPQTDKVVDAFYRWVVYIPWATPESSGLPTSPMVDGGPWIMFPGTHSAHIMITPPRIDQN